MGSVGVHGSRIGPPVSARSARPGWGVPALAGAGAFWLANLAISLTPVAAGYRSALAIPYLPMLAEAAAGGLVVAAAVAFLLARFSDRVPGHGVMGKALGVTIGAVTRARTSGQDRHSLGDEEGQP